MRSQTRGLLLALLTMPVIMASDPEGARIVEVLQIADALTPERAMTAYELGADGSRTLRRLVRRGVIASAGADRYCVNVGAVSQFQRRRFLTAGAVAILVAGVTAAVTAAAWHFLRPSARPIATV